jgi:hypothetical protein
LRHHAGNLADNLKAFMLAIDYRRRQRVKIWGRGPGGLRTTRRSSRS